MGATLDAAQSFPRRRIWVMGAALAAIVAVACGSDEDVLGENQRTTTVALGDLVTQVSVNGSLVFPERAALTFGSQGTVAEVLVQEGQAVREGQPLARLDDHATAVLETAVAQARVDLRDARTALDSVAESSGGSAAFDVDTSGLSEAEIELQIARREWDAKLEQGSLIYADAVDDYRSIVKGWLGVLPADDELGTSPADLVSSWGVTLEDILDRDALVTPKLQDINVTPFSDDLATPWSELTVFGWLWLYPGDVVATCGQTYYIGVNDRCAQRELEEAWDAFGDAKIEWDRLQLEAALAVGGVGDALDLALRESQVVTAEAALETALDRLDRATLKSPWDGVVALVNVAAGDAVSAGTLVVEVADPTVVELDAIVDEIDVLSIREGVRAEVQMDAFPGGPLPGTVTALAAAPQNQQGVVSFPIRIRLELPRRLQLPEGLSAVANVIVQEERDVLKVPLQSLQRGAQGPVVLVMHEGQIEERSVLVGASNGFEVVIEGGLSEGEQVVVDGQDVGGGGFGFGSFGGFRGGGGGLRGGGGAVRIERAPATGDHN